VTITHAKLLVRRLTMSNQMIAIIHTTIVHVVLVASTIHHS